MNNDEIELKNNAIIHKDNSLNRLDLSFLKHIELNEYKKSDLLAYWINDFAEYHDEEGTVLQGYQVFGKEETLPIYEDDKVKSIALKYNKTTRQIAMKYLVQNRISVITRPMEKQYMKDNLNLFDFQLNEEEMSYLSTIS